MPIEKILVSEILNFVIRLEQSNSNLPADHDAINKLKERFKGMPLDSAIMKKHQDLFVFFSNLFTLRSEQVLDEPGHDYTFSASDANLLWIEFAKRLALVFDTTYIKFLFPNIINTVDLIGLTPLAATNNATSFFIGDDNRILFNKRDLCAFLMANPSLIVRASHASEKILTIKELFRLRSEKSEFKINEQHYISVWDFLEKVIFPTLNPTQNIPQTIILDFFLLIDQFYKLKRENASISQFKDKLDLFCQKINHNDVDKNNLLHLYGLRISINEQTYYFVHILIYLYQARDYDLDHYLNPVLNWLYSFNNKTETNDVVNQTVTYLISLFSNINYEGQMRISVGNLSRYVNADISNIYIKFEQAINAKEINIDQVVAIYMQLLHNDPARTPLFFSSKTEPELYVAKNVLQRTLAERDVNNYPIELIIHSILRYKLKNSTIHSFLDKLLYISCSDINEITKRLQANIILTELLKKADAVMRIEILLYFKECSHESYERLFLSNCADYIKNQLLERIPSLAEKNAVECNLNDLIKGRLTLSELLTSYKREIASFAQSIGKETLINLQEYLSRLSSSDPDNYILEASSSVEPLGIF